MELYRFLPLVVKWTEFQKKWHEPKFKNWEVHFTTGSQDGCSKIFDLLIDKGQPVMVQTPTYTGTLGAVSFLKIIFTLNFINDINISFYNHIEKLDVKNDVKNDVNTAVKNDVKKDVKNGVKNEVKNWDSFLRHF